MAARVVTDAAPSHARPEAVEREARGVRGRAPGEPTLEIAPDAWRRITALILATSTEVAGIGAVEPTAEGFRLTEAFVVRQAADHSSTTLDPGGLAELVGRRLDEGRDVRDLRVWWHSHVDEPPFWSGVDERTILGFGSEWVVSLVIGGGMRMLARVDHIDPRSTEWLWPIAPESVASRQEIEDAARELSALVEPR